MLSNNCSILLIDDDADVLDAYTQLLEQAGYHVSACNNPFDAREQVPKDWPGIVLSDVCMPGCSGIDLMTLFHQDDDLLPILLIASAFSSWQKRILRYGFTASREPAA